jgi:hypothetical protein
MKKLLFAASLVFFLQSCQKEIATKQETESTTVMADASPSTARKTSSEFQTYIRKWIEWIFTRDISLAPYNDPDGSLQYLGQPYSSGVFMLAGGSSPDPVDRTVEISLSQYQYIFVPLVNFFAFYDICDPNFAPNGGQNPAAFFNSLITKTLNGPRELTLLWDGNSLLSTKQKDERGSSGVWEFKIDPSWNNGCTDAVTSTFYADGYWAKIPLTLGTHTLVVGGNLNYRHPKAEFANLVNYTINVVP